MIHAVENFYNQMATSIRGKYFPTVNHSTTTDKKYRNAMYAIECFNNGVLTYRQFIERLSRACNSTNYDLNQVVEKQIISFGEYRYKPKKP